MSIPGVLFVSVGIIAALFAGSVLLNSLVLMIICGILYVVVLIVGSTMYVTMINTVHRLSTETNPLMTIVSQYRFGFGLLWSSLLVLIISVLVAYGSLVAFVIPGILLAGYTCMCLFTLTIDGKKGFSALTESYTLVYGRWWVVFGRMLLLGMICAGIGIAYELCSILVIAILGVMFPAIAVSIIMAIAIFVFEAALISFAMVYMYQLYSSLKATRVSTIPIKSIKPWLVAALILGIFAFIGYVYFMVSFIGSGLNQQSRYRTQMNNPQAQLQIQL